MTRKPIRDSAKSMNELCLFTKRRAFAGSLSVLALTALPLLFNTAQAGGAGGDPEMDPCRMEDPPEWCDEHEPPTTAHPVGATQADIVRFEEPPPAEGPPLFLVGSTLVAPPPVLWLNGRPSDPSRVFGVGEAATFVKSLELILPAGWTIWTSEDLRTLKRAVGERVLWNGNGQLWSDVLEALAQQYGVEITADIVSRRAVFKLAAGTEAEGPGQTVQDVRSSLQERERPIELQAVSAEENEPRSGRRHPAYRKYTTPTRLSAEPLPDTVGRVAWRLAPPEVQMDLGALGAYINAPVFHWDLEGSFVSPQAALAALMPAGFCLDEDSFPAVRAVACDESLSSGAAAPGMELDENSF